MNPEQQLAGWLKGDVAIVGVGNRFRGDDAAGSLAAGRIPPSPRVTVIDARETPEDYVAELVSRRPGVVVFIDSVEMGSDPGSIAFLDRSQMAGYWPTTHRMPLAALMEIVERETGARVFAIGIQPGHTAFLRPMSGAVAASVAQAAGMLTRALAGRPAAARGSAAESSRGGVCL